MSKIIINDSTEYALHFDGLNDSVRGSGLVLPNVRNSPFTIFIRYKNMNDLTSTTFKFFFNITDSVTNQQRMLFFIQSNVLRFRLNNTSWPAKDIRWNPTLLPSEGTLQLRYNGLDPNNPTNYDLFSNGVLYTFGKWHQFGLSTAPVQSSNARISIGDSFNITIHNMSIVDYAKSNIDISTDHNLGLQQQGSGDYLLRVIKTYPAYITTLNSADTFQELSQSIPLEHIGRTTLLNLSTDFRPESGAKKTVLYNNKLLNN